MCSDPYQQCLAPGFIYRLSLISGSRAGASLGTPPWKRDTGDWNEQWEDDRFTRSSRLPHIARCGHTWSPTASRTRSVLADEAQCQ
eukprot:291746-Amphidinium_carterae.1